MTNRRRVQSINPKDPKALEKVIEALEVSEGVRGNKNDRKPTISEVQQMISSGGVLPAVSGGGDNTSPGQGGSQVIPGRPSAVTAVVIQDGIVIHWAMPAYSGHGKTEVWRSATELLQDAAQIGFTGGNSFVDYEAGNGQQWTYFMRHVVDVSLGANTGPFSAGLSATSAPAKQVLTAAKGYTDDREAAAVQAANSYTDTQIGNLSIIPDAPSDGKIYARQNGAWVEII